MFYGALHLITNKNVVYASALVLITLHIAIKNSEAQYIELLNN